MVAMGIVAIATASCFQIFYTIRRLNERARFYSKVLPFVRERFNDIVTSHQLATPGTYPETFDDIAYERKVEADTEYPKTCQKVTLTFGYREQRTGSEHRLTFQTYVSSAIVNKVEQQ